MSDVIQARFGGNGGGGKTASQQPRIRLTGVTWPGARLGTMPDPRARMEPDGEGHALVSDDSRLAFDGRDYWVAMGAIVCRGRRTFTCVLPAMGQPARPEYMALATNDRD